MKGTNYPDSKALLELYDEDLKRLEKRIGKDRSANTLSSMRQGRKYVAAFFMDQLKCQDIPADELESSLIEDFSTYLSAERGLRGGTVWLSCLQLKGVVRRAYQRGDLSKDPFNGFHIHKKIRPREYLTEEELIQLMNHPFQKKNLCLARDIFIFSALTGLSFIDIQELRPTDVRDIDGAAWIISSPVEGRSHRERESGAGAHEYRHDTDLCPHHIPETECRPDHARRQTECVV